MTFFQAENLLDAGDFEACAELAAELVAETLGTPTAQLQAQAHILLAKARQGAGLLEQAADAARTAADLIVG